MGLSNNVQQRNIRRGRYAMRKIASAPFSDAGRCRFVDGPSLLFLRTVSSGSASLRCHDTTSVVFGAIMRALLKERINGSTLTLPLTVNRKFGRFQDKNDCRVIENRRMSAQKSF